MSCRRPVCRLNKQCAWLNLDVSEFVEQSEIVEVETLRHQQSILSGTMEKLLLHLTGACVEHNAELRKTNMALWRSAYNALLPHNPNQGVITTAQEDKEYTRTEITRHTTQA